MRSIIASLSLTVLTPIAFAEVEWKMDFSRLACTVTNSHGFFNSYSVPPSKGDNIQINLQAIVKKRSVFKFTPHSRSSGPKPYIPYPGPFVLDKRIYDPDLQYIALRYVSSDSTSSVTLDVSNYGHHAPERIKASILVEGAVVDAVSFLECQIVE